MWIKRLSNKIMEKRPNLFFTNEEWPEISEEYGKISSIKTRRNRFFGKDEALGNFKVFYQNVRGLKSKIDSLGYYAAFDF